MPRNAERSEATRVRMGGRRQYTVCTEDRLEELHPARIDARLCRMAQRLM